MASLALVPIVLGALYTFALVSGPVLHDIKTKSNKPDDIYASTDDVKDVQDGYFRIIIVVQSKTSLRVAKLSTQSYSQNGTAYLGEKISEAICGDSTGIESKISGIKYHTFTCKLESGKNYQVAYGKQNFGLIWTFADSTFRINSADIPKVSGRTHYVYFDQDGYFAAGGRFYKSKDLF